MFVSCWHANVQEAPALWAMHASRAGIAIKSTVGRLKAAVIDEKPFHIVSVTYLDFEGEGDSSRIGFGTDIPAFLKHKVFEQEQEVRVVMLHARAPVPESQRLACNIPALIDQVYLSPESDDWLIPHVKLLLDKFGFGEILVQKSKLYTKQT
jgi:hypothetical protein